MEKRFGTDHILMALSLFVIVLFDYHFYSAMLILRHVKDYPDMMEV